MSHEPKPSEHAIAAGEQIAHDSERFAQIRVYLTPDWCADIIQELAIAPSVAELTRENEEQARLLGAGASREAALMAQVGERDRRIAELEEALRRISDMAGKQPALMSEEGLRAMSETVGLEAEAVLAKSERSAP